jgi:hypothetical protein
MEHSHTFIRQLYSFPSHTPLSMSSDFKPTAAMDVSSVPEEVATPAVAAATESHTETMTLDEALDRLKVSTHAPIITYDDIRAFIESKRAKGMDDATIVRTTRTNFTLDAISHDLIYRHLQTMSDTERAAFVSGDPEPLLSLDETNALVSALMHAQETDPWTMEHLETESKAERSILLPLDAPIKEVIRREIVRIMHGHHAVLEQVRRTVLIKRRTDAFEYAEIHGTNSEYRRMFVDPSSPTTTLHCIQPRNANKEDQATRRKAIASVVESDIRPEHIHIELSDIYEASELTKIERDAEIKRIKAMPEPSTVAPPITVQARLELFWRTCRMWTQEKHDEYEREYVDYLVGVTRDRADVWKGMASDIYTKGYTSPNKTIRIEPRSPFDLELTYPSLSRADDTRKPEPFLAIRTSHDIEQREPRPHTEDVARRIQAMHDADPPNGRLALCIVAVLDSISPLAHHTKRTCVLQLERETPSNTESA